MWDVKEALSGPAMARELATVTTVYNLGWGCAVCNPDISEEDDDEDTYAVAILDVHGITNYGADFPSYEELLQEGIYLVRSCQRLSYPELEEALKRGIVAGAGWFG